MAQLVCNILDQAPVKEDADSEGFFVEKYPAGVTYYEDIFGLRAAGVNDKVSGKFKGADTTNGTITITEAGVDVTKAYAAGLVIYGKDSLEQLEAQFVTATVNKDDEIVFLEVTTPAEVSGDISSVNTVNLTVKVAGTDYKVATDADIFMNGNDVPGTISAKLVAISGSAARLLLNKDGKVYRIEASALDKSGTLTSKSTTIGLDGKVVQKVTIDGTDYYLKPETVIVRNGGSSSFAELQNGDDIEFSATGTELNYVDAFSQVIRGALVVTKRNEVGEHSLTVVKDGATTTYKIRMTSSGASNLDVSGTGAVYWANVAPNTYYDLFFNRSGRIQRIEKVSAQFTAQTTTIKGKVQTVSSDGTVYSLELNNGQTLNLPLDKEYSDLFACKIYKNGLDLDLVDGVEDKKYPVSLWGTDPVEWIASGDKIRIERTSAGVIQAVYLYSVDMSVSAGLLKAIDTANNTITVKAYDYESGDPEIDYVFKVDSNTAIALNGLTGRTLADVAANLGSSDLFTHYVSMTVNFDAEQAGESTFVPNLLSDVDATDFAFNGYVRVYSIEIDGDTYVIHTVGLSSKAYIVADKNTRVVKGGSASSLSAVGIGDLIQADSREDKGVAKFVSVRSDTGSPSATLTSYSAKGYNPTTGDPATLTVKVNEATSSMRIVVDGVEYTPERTDSVFRSWRVRLVDANGDPITTYASGVKIAVYLEYADLSGNKRTTTKTWTLE